MPHLFRVEVNMAGVGKRGEEIVGDPVLWAEYVEEGLIVDLGPYDEPPKYPIAPRGSITYDSEAMRAMRSLSEVEPEA